MAEDYQNGIQFEEVSPGWQAEGAEPRPEMKTEGFIAGYRPPAGYFNWFWARVSRCISELQQKISAHSQNNTNPHSVTKEQVGLKNVANVAALPLTGGVLTGNVTSPGYFYGSYLSAQTHVSIGYSGTGVWYDKSSGELQFRANTRAAARHIDASTYMPMFASAFNPASSLRYKENITDLTEEEALLILSLKPRKYTLKELGDTQYGFIAEEVDSIDKNYVAYDNEEPEALNYMSMIAPMIFLLQKQQKQIDSLQTQLLQMQNAQTNALKSTEEEKKS